MPPMKVAIAIDPASRGTICLDGVDISKHVRGLRVEARVDDVSRVTLELINVQIDIKGEVGRVLQSLAYEEEP